MSKLKGKELMIFVGDTDAEPIAMAKSCSLELNSTLTDETTKDDNDQYDYNEVTGQSWSLSTENLICTTTGANWKTLTDLVANQTNRVPIYVSFVLVSDSLGHAKDQDSESWSTNTITTVVNGQALISSLEVNGAIKETATFSATFTGQGAITIA